MSAAEGAIPSNITDHPFDPRGEWYTLCVCGLAEAAHKTTTRVLHHDVTVTRSDTGARIGGDSAGWSERLVDGDTTRAAYLDRDTTNWNGATARPLKPGEQLCPACGGRGTKDDKDCDSCDGHGILPAPEEDV